MKHKWTSNLSLKFLSLFVAFLIWLLVANVNNPTRSLLYRDVKIDIINEDSVTEIDKVLDIVSEDTVTIKVTAPKYVHETLTKDSFTVIADMENLSAMNTVPLTVTCSNPSVSWANMEIVPSTLKVELEQKKQSEFAVVLSWSECKKRDIPLAGQKSYRERACRLPDRKVLLIGSGK